MKSYNHAIVFSGLVFDVEQMDVEIGRCGCHTYQVIRHPGGAGVLPVHEDGTITLIKQLRPAISNFTYEIPAGRLDQGEDPQDCAVRELSEESGITAETVVSLGTIYSSPGVFDEIIHLFAATGITQGLSHPEEYEDIEIVRIPLSVALEMIIDGSICDAKTIAAITRWDLKQRGKRTADA